MMRRFWAARITGALSAILVLSVATTPASGAGALPTGAGATTSSAAAPLLPVHVTVTIDSVGGLNGMDLSIIDGEIIIDQEGFVGAPAFPASIGDTIRPGWRFTKQVDPSRAVFEDSVPIRIRVHGSTPRLPVGRLQLDVDPFACKSQCAYLDVGRPSSDERGLDLWLDLVTGGVRQNEKSWAGGTGPWCAAGTSFFAAEICFNVTRSHFTVPRKSAVDSYDGRCHLNDCSLFQAVRDAGTPGTELFLPAGSYILDERLLFKTPGVTVTGLPGGVVIMQPAVDERVVEVEDEGKAWSRPVILRGLTLFGGYSGKPGLRGHRHGGGVHNHGTLEMHNVTITGNYAPSNGGGLDGRGGGGFYNANKATLRNVTIAGNLAGNDGAGLSGSPTSETSVQNTLVVHNLGGDGNCTVSLGPNGTEQIDFQVEDLGGNLEYPGDTCGVAFANTDQDPALAREAKQERSWTWPLVRGGPAVDTGVFAEPGSSQCFLDRDQLDVPRPQPGSRGAPAQCDIGALELQLSANTAPLVAIQPPGTGYRTTEGAPVQVNALASDPTNDPLTYAWSPPASFDDPTSPSPHFIAAQEGVYPIEVRVTDGELAATAASVVTVENVAPAVESLTATHDGVVIAGTQVTMTAAIADPGVTDTQTCTFSWDDPMSPDETVVTGIGAGTGTCLASHRFMSAGVYQIAVTADDGDGGQARGSTLVVVFDPSAGRITGAGQLNSPAGALLASPTTSSTAIWSVHARYPRRSQTPIGQVDFRLKGRHMQFESDTLSWLVVDGPRFQMGGTGAVSGLPGYRFLLSGVDGDLPGGDGTDRLRLKIVAPHSAQVVYDNVIDPAATDDLDTAYPAPIRRGNLKSH